MIFNTTSTRGGNSRLTCGGMAAAGLLCAGLTAGCSGIGVQASPTTDSRREIDSHVQAYLRLAADLGQHDVDSLDYAYGPAESPANAVKDLPSEKDIRNSALELEKKVDADPSSLPGDRERNAFLSGQLRAIAARAETLAGTPASFDEESLASFGLTPPADFDRRQVQGIQKQLETLLPGKGELAERYDAFDRRFVIPPGRVPAVLAKAIEECRSRTSAHIHLPSGESIRIEYVSNRPWAAYSWYKGNYHSVIQFNTDFPLTVDRALDLACHETYPGHHVYNSLREQELVRGKHILEYSAQPTYSPQSLVSESMATLAPEVAFPPADRLRFEQKVLFPLAALDQKDSERYLKVEALIDRLHPVEPSIAREYLDGKLEFERAAARLERSALMAHPEAALLYLNEYRSYVTTYTYGRDLVSQTLDRRSHGNHALLWTAYEQMIFEQPETLFPQKEELARAGVQQGNVRQKGAAP